VGVRTAREKDDISLLVFFFFFFFFITVTFSSPIFISTVATRSNAVGMASRATTRDWEGGAAGGGAGSTPRRSGVTASAAAAAARPDRATLSFASARGRQRDMPANMMVVMAQGLVKNLVVPSREGPVSS